MTTNPQGTITPIVLTEDEMQALTGASKVIVDILGPKAVVLDTYARQTMVKMSPKDFEQMDKTLSYAQANPQFVPNYMSVDTLAQHVAAIHVLRGLEQAQGLAVKVLGDALMMSCAEAMAGVSTFYQSVKQAARRKLLGAQAIYDDLRQRFALRTPRATGATPAADDEGAEPGKGE